MAGRLIPAALLAAMCLLAAPGWAASSLPEPNRPWTASDADGAGIGEAALPELQMVLLPRKGKPVAVISGERVVLGGRYRDATLIAVRENKVILLDAEGRRELHMTPEISKKPAAEPGKRVKRSIDKGD